MWNDKTSSHLLNLCKLLFLKTLTSNYRISLSNCEFGNYWKLYNYKCTKQNFNTPSILWLCKSHLLLHILHLPGQQAVGFSHAKRERKHLQTVNLVTGHSANVSLHQQQVCRVASTCDWIRWLRWHLAENNFIEFLVALSCLLDFCQNTL